MKNFKKYYEVILLALLSLTPMLWLSGDFIILGHDSGFRLKYAQYLVDLFYSWNPNMGFGADLSINKGFLITQLPETLLSVVFNSLQLGQKLSLVLWFFLIGFSMYIFTNTFFADKKYWPVRMLSSVLYMYNFFVLQGWFIAERAKFSLMIALPLMLVIIYKVLQKEWSLPKGSVLFGLLFLVFNGGGSPPLYGSVIFTALIAIFLLTIFNIYTKGIKEIIYSLKTVLFMGLTTFVFNAYWIFPQIYLAFSSYANTLSSQGGIQGIMQWEAVVSKSASIINLLRLQGVPDWYGNSMHPYAKEYIENPLLIFLSFVPLIFILIGLFFYSKFELSYRKNILILLVLVIFFVGLLFTGGSHDPFGFVYVQFLKHVPGFAVFRSAFYKFGPMLWFSASFLTAYCLYGLYTLANKNVLLKGVIVILIARYLLMYVNPYFVSDFFAWNKPFSTRVVLPDYVSDVSNEINNSKSSQRTLLLPQISGGADQYTWGFWSLDLLPRLTLNGSIVANDGPSSVLLSDLYDLIYTRPEDALYFFDIFRINSILLRKDSLDLAAGGGMVPMQLHLDKLKEFTNSPRLRKHTEQGKWAHYDLSESSPSASIAKNIIVYTGDVNLVNLLSLLNFPENPALVAKSDLGKISGALNVISEEIISAYCLVCTPADTWIIENGVEFPVPNLLPGGLLYSVVVNKESEYKRSILQSIPARIDAGLSYSTLRLAELNQLLAKETQETTEEDVRNTIARYEKEIGDLLLALGQLESSEKDRYRLRVLGYLNVHLKYLESIGNRHNLAEKEFNELILFISGKVDSLSSEAALLPGTSQYAFDVQSGGTFDILPSQSGNNLTFTIDGQIVETSDVPLSTGSHRLGISRTAEESLVDAFIPAQRVSLDYRQELSFSTKGAKSGANYLVQVVVSDLEGRDPFLQIDELHQDDNGEIVLSSTKKDFNRVQNSYARIHRLHPLATSLRVRLKRDGYAHEKSEFVLANVSIVPVSDTDLYLRKKIEDKLIQQPKISAITKIDPTLYSTSVTQAKDPYLMLFAQQYNAGWRTYIVPSGSVKNTRDFLTMLPSARQVDTINHVKVNLFENGWFISEAGSYDVVFFYWPQLYFYLGLTASVLSVIVTFGIIIYKKRHKI